ncbi:MAG: TfoX/Sxy family protein [Dehalococcoidia bacterium]|nr:TfoX/Sxy family protein [Dehalococcoidia bacterium]
MPYNQKLAERVRALLADEPDLVEKKMFGGVCFMLAGNMCVGVNRDDLMVRVALEDAPAVSTRPHVRPMDITGRPARNFFFVGPEATNTARGLAAWVNRGRAFARSLPPK